MTALSHRPGFFPADRETRRALDDVIPSAGELYAELNFTPQSRHLRVVHPQLPNCGISSLQPDLIEVLSAPAQMLRPDGSVVPVVGPALGLRVIDIKSTLSPRGSGAYEVALYALVLSAYLEASRRVGADGTPLVVVPQAGLITAELFPEVTVDGEGQRSDEASDGGWRLERALTLLDVPSMHADLMQAIVFVDRHRTDEPAGDVEPALLAPMSPGEECAACPFLGWPTLGERFGGIEGLAFRRLPQVNQSLLASEPQGKVALSCAAQFAARRQALPVGVLEAGERPGLGASAEAKQQFKALMDDQVIPHDFPVRYQRPAHGLLRFENGKWVPTREDEASSEDVLGRGVSFMIWVHAGPTAPHHAWLPGEVWGVEVMMRSARSGPQAAPERGAVWLRSSGEEGQRILARAFRLMMAALLAKVSPAPVRASLHLWDEHQLEALRSLWLIDQEKPVEFASEYVINSVWLSSLWAFSDPGEDAESDHRARQKLLELETEGAAYADELFEAWFSPVAFQNGIETVLTLAGAVGSWPEGTAEPDRLLRAFIRASDSARQALGWDGAFAERASNSISKLLDRLDAYAKFGAFDGSGRMTWVGAQLLLDLRAQLGEQPPHDQASSVEANLRETRGIQVLSWAYSLCEAALQAGERQAFSSLFPFEFSGKSTLTELMRRPELDAEALLSLWSLMERSAFGQAKYALDQLQRLPPETLIERGEAVQIRSVAQGQRGLGFEILKGELEFSPGALWRLFPVARGVQPHEPVDEATLALLASFAPPEVSSFALTQLKVDSERQELVWAAATGEQGRRALDVLVSRQGASALLVKVPYLPRAARSHPVAAASALQRLLTRMDDELVPGFAAQPSEQLDEAQHAAVQGASRRVSLIWGPPGAGKSSTLRALVRSELKRGGRVLVTATSYAAIDAVLRGLAQPQARAYRMYGSRGEALIPGIEDVRQIPKGAWDEGALLVGAVVSKIASLPEGAFDLIIVDEASQVGAWELPWIAPLLSSQGRLVSCGDHLQLPVIRALRVGRSAMSVSLGSLHGFFSHRGAHLTPLTRGYRSLPEITSLVQRAGYSSFEPHRPPASPLALAGLPDLPLGVIVHTARMGKGRRSVEEAQAAAYLMSLAIGEPQPELVNRRVGVVVPHRVQRTAVQAALRSRGLGAFAVDVDTADSFQGQERDVIVVSPGMQRAVGSSREFLLSLERLNVMFSRPRERLILLVHADLAEQMRASGNAQLRALLQLPFRADVELPGLGAARFFGA